MLKFIKTSVFYQQYVLEMILYVPATARKKFTVEEKRKDKKKRKNCKDRQRENDCRMKSDTFFKISRLQILVDAQISSNRHLCPHN